LTLLLHAPRLALEIVNPVSPEGQPLYSFLERNTRCAALHNRIILRIAHISNQDRDVYHPAFAAGLACKLALPIEYGVGPNVASLKSFAEACVASMIEHEPPNAVSRPPQYYRQPTSDAVKSLMLQAIRRETSVAWQYTFRVHDAQIRKRAGCADTGLVPTVFGCTDGRMDSEWYGTTPNCLCNRRRRSYAGEAGLIVANTQPNNPSAAAAISVHHQHVTNNIRDVNGGHHTLASSSAANVNEPVSTADAIIQIRANCPSDEAHTEIYGQAIEDFKDLLNPADLREVEVVTARHIDPHRNVAPAFVNAANGDSGCMLVSVWNKAGGFARMVRAGLIAIFGFQWCGPELKDDASGQDLADSIIAAATEVTKVVDGDTVMLELYRDFLSQQEIDGGDHLWRGFQVTAGSDLTVEPYASLHRDFLAYLDQVKQHDFEGDAFVMKLVGLIYEVNTTFITSAPMPGVFTTYYHIGDHHNNNGNAVCDELVVICDRNTHQVNHYTVVKAEKFC